MPLEGTAKVELADIKLACKRIERERLGNVRIDIADDPGAERLLALMALCGGAGKRENEQKLGHEMHGKPLGRGARERGELLEALKEGGDRHRKILDRVKIALPERNAVDLRKRVFGIRKPLDREMKHIPLIGLVTADIHIVKFPGAEDHQGIGAKVVLLPLHHIFSRTAHHINDLIMRMAMARKIIGLRMLIHRMVKADTRIFLHGIRVHFRPPFLLTAIIVAHESNICNSFDNFYNGKFRLLSV